MTNFFYRVETGDTVFSISVKLGVSPCSIISQNNLKKEVEAGDLLYIVKDPDCKLYTVQPFDTPELLAERFFTTPERLLEKNAISYLFYGLIITI